MSIREVSFWVPGIAKPAGSKRGFVNPKTGGVIIVDACKKGKPWQADVKAFAYEAMNGQPLMTDPLVLVVVFQQGRPKSHFRTGRNSHIFRDDAPSYPTSAPDATKLVRAIEDAMTGVVWRDDAQIVDQLVRKRYGEPGAMITVKVKEEDRLLGLEEPIRDDKQMELLL